MKAKIAATICLIAALIAFAAFKYMTVQVVIGAVPDDNINMEKIERLLNGQCEFGIGGSLGYSIAVQRMRIEFAKKTLRDAKKNGEISITLLPDK